MGKKKKSLQAIERDLVRALAVMLGTVVISALQDNAANRVSDTINRNRARRQQEYIPYEDVK